MFSSCIKRCIVAKVGKGLLHNPLVQRTQVLTYLMLPNLVSRVCSIDRPYRIVQRSDKAYLLNIESVL